MKTSILRLPRLSPLGLSRSTVYELMARQSFPANFPLGCEPGLVTRRTYTSGFGSASPGLHARAVGLRDARQPRRSAMTRPANRRRVRALHVRVPRPGEAGGSWQLADDLQQCGVDGRYLKNSHGPCPGCGGEDRFRFDDKDGRGTFFCNQRTPPAGDGFDLLQHVHGWTSRQTLHRVADGARDSIASGQEPARRHIDPDVISGPQSTRTGIENSHCPRPIPLAFERIVRIVSGCGAITADGEVLRYLRARGLLGIEKDLPADLLQHPALATSKMASASAGFRPWLRAYGIFRAR